MAGCRKPYQEPAKLSGTLIKNQMAMMASMVVKGTAPLDPLAHTKRLRKKKIRNTVPGTNSGVSAMLSFHFSPPKPLYVRAEKYPPMQLNKM